MERIDAVNLQNFREYIINQRKRGIILVDSNIILDNVILKGNTRGKVALAKIKNSRFIGAIPDFIYEESKAVSKNLGYRKEVNSLFENQDIILLNTNFKKIYGRANLDTIIQKAPENYQNMLKKYIKERDIDVPDLALVTLGLNASIANIDTIILSENVGHIGRELQKEINIVREQYNCKYYLRIRNSENISI
jgi:hypothetical protein